MGNTRLALEDPQVRHEARAGDPEEAAYKQLNEDHKRNLEALKAAGMATHTLQASVPELPPVRETHTFYCTIVP